MKLLVVLALLVSTALAQDILTVACDQDAITARFEKKVAETANYQMTDLHFTDPTCTFEEDDGEYYIRRIEPLLACGTIYTVNDTHVTYFNSISSGAVESSLSAPHGIIIGQPTNNQLISVSLTCTYKIDLRVSAAFIPNITYVFIEIPDVAEYGIFKVGMELYRTDTYADPYGESTPLIDAGETVYVGVQLLGDYSPDLFLLVKDCWATVFEDPESDPYYYLIEDECPVNGAVEGSVAITQNGESYQALWQTQVFKFVGSTDDFNTVWLHCDVTLCIKKACRPECGARRRRRAAGDFGNADTKTITIGPVERMDITLRGGEKGIEHIIISNNTYPETPRDAREDTGINSSMLIIIGALAAFCLLCLSMALIVVVMRLKRSQNRGGDSGVTTTGTINKGFSI